MDIESVYRQYFKDVFLYLRSLSADAGTAEEIAQETFMKALRSLDSFDAQGISERGFLRSQEIPIIRSAAGNISMLMRAVRRNMGRVQADAGFPVSLRKGQRCTEM